MRPRPSFLRLVAALAFVLCAAPATAEEPDVLLERGEAAFAAGDFETAETLFDAAVLHPDLPADTLAWALLLRGRTRALLGRTDQALADMGLAMLEDWCWPATFATRALLAIEQGDATLALAFAGHAVRIDPENPTGHVARAAALHALGFADDSLREKERAATLPGSPGDYLHAGVYCDVGLGRIDPARALVAGLVAAGTASDEMLALDALLAAPGDPDAARTVLADLATRAPDSQASLWLALLSPPDKRRALLEARLAADSLDLPAGLALAAMPTDAPDPFASWAALVEGRPTDPLAEQAFALGRSLPLAPEQAAALAEQARAGLERPFGMARAYAVAIALERQGEAELAAELHTLVARGKLPYADPLVMLVARWAP